MTLINLSDLTNNIDAAAALGQANVDEKPRKQLLEACDK